MNPQHPAIRDTAAAQPCRQRLHAAGPARSPHPRCRQHRSGRNSCSGTEIGLAEQTTRQTNAPNPTRTETRWCKGIRDAPCSGPVTGQLGGAQRIAYRDLSSSLASMRTRSRVAVDRVRDERRDYPGRWRPDGLGSSRTQAWRGQRFGRSVRPADTDAAKLIRTLGFSGWRADPGAGPILMPT